MFIDSLTFELINKISLDILKKSFLGACSQKQLRQFPFKKHSILFILLELIKLLCVVPYSYSELVLDVRLCFRYLQGI